MDLKEKGGCALRILIGITIISIFLAGSAGAETISVEGGNRLGFLKIHDAINSDYKKNSVSSIDHSEFQISYPGNGNRLHKDSFSYGSNLKGQSPYAEKSMNRFANRFAIQDTTGQTSNACAVMCHFYKTEPITGDSFPNTITNFNRRETFLGILSERPDWVNITSPNIEFRWDPTQLNGNKWDYFTKTQPFYYDESGRANFKLRNFSQYFVGDGTYAVDLISSNEFPGFSISRVLSNGGLITESGDYTINVTVILYESSDHISIGVDLWQNDLITAKLNSWSASGSPTQNNTGSNNEWVNIGYDQPVYPVQYNFNVTYHVDKILPGKITYKPHVWVERNTAGRWQAVGVSTNTSIQSNQFRMNASFSNSNPVWWSWSETVIKRAELKEIMEVQDPFAQFSFNKDFIVVTGDNSVSSGIYDRRIRYGMDIFNGGDASGTVLGNLRFSAEADNITAVDWSQYAVWNKTSVKWDFPLSLSIYENNGFGTGFNTNRSESRFMNVSIDRWMNQTIFNDSGYQLLKFNITFANTDFKWAWVHVGANDRYEVKASIVKGTFTGNVPGYFDEREHGAHFNFDMNSIQPGVTYSFSIVVNINLTGNAEPPIRYKPGVSVGMGRYYNSTVGQGYNVDMPEEMLPDNIHHASASTDINNAWLLKRHNHDIAVLGEVSELAGPHAVFMIQKELSVSTDNDSLYSGMNTPHVGNLMAIYNQFDDSSTVLGDMGFSAEADNITDVNWGQYVTWNKTSVNWKFPSDYTINENTLFWTGFDTNDSESMPLNASIDRWMNRTEFNQEGYQLSKFNVTFLETGFQSMLWADIYAGNLNGAHVSIVPGTFTTNAPGNVWEWEHGANFNFDMNLVRPGVKYNFSVVIKVSPAIEKTAPIHYKPTFGVGLRDSNYGNGGSGYTVEVSPSMLPEHVTRATAITNIFNAWQVWRNNQVSMWLTDITPPVITNFSVLPDTPLNTSNPGRAFADIADANLGEVMFGIVDINNLVDDNMIIGLSINMSGINGRYSSPEWHAKIWSITNGTAKDIVTVIDLQDDLRDDLLVAGMFKKNSMASEEFAIMWFNKTSGQLSNLTLAPSERDLSTTTLTIESGSSTFKTAEFKGLYENTPLFPVYGMTYTLYSIGSANNPSLVSMPVPTGVYKAFVRAVDMSGNENVLFSDVQVDNLVSFPGQTGLPTDPDGDSLFEDLNGNGRKDFNDVVLFFNDLEWILRNEPVSIFDFNGNGRIDFEDIVKLFEEV